MTSVQEAIAIQKDKYVLVTPKPTAGKSAMVKLAGDNGGGGGGGTPNTIDILLQNTTSSPQVYVTLTGLDTTKNSQVWLLQSDGKTGYYPENPGQAQAPLDVDCTIMLGGPGSSLTVTVPHIAGGRIWYCLDGPLVFKRNPGEYGCQLSEPSVTNEADPNYGQQWGFVELTLDPGQVFMNITYVDFVSIPVAFRLDTNSGKTQEVKGIPKDGLQTIANMLTQQTATDGSSWDQLIIKNQQGGPLRVLAPNAKLVMDGSLFANYYDPYISSVWQKYSTESLNINTQVEWGTIQCKVQGDGFTIPNVGTITKPTSQEIFACNGAFPGSNDQIGNVGARIAAAFNRSTLLTNASQPDNEDPAQFYTNPVTNHYSRIVHATNIDKLGYAFPYDDVGSDGGQSQEGSVASSDPKLVTVFIGGGGGSGGSGDAGASPASSASSGPAAPAAPSTPATPATPAAPSAAAPSPPSAAAPAAPSAPSTPAAPAVPTTPAAPVVPTTPAAPAAPAAPSAPSAPSPPSAASANSSTTTTNVNLGEMTRPGRQIFGGRHIRRGLEWSSTATAADEKAALMAADDDDASQQHQQHLVDLEQGYGPVSGEKLAMLQGRNTNTNTNSMAAEMGDTSTKSVLSALPQSLVARGEAMMERIESSPIFTRLRPAVDLFVRLVTAFLSLSVRAAISRVAMICLFFVFYFLVGPVGQVLGFDRYAGTGPGGMSPSLSPPPPPPPSSFPPMPSASGMLSL